MPITRANDYTIYESFDILGVPESSRSDTRLFVLMSALMNTEHGKAAARSTGLLEFFDECLSGYDEEEMGHWPARDYAMRVIARNTKPMHAQIDTQTIAINGNGSQAKGR
jgi:hypothetical protein